MGFIFDDGTVDRGSHPTRLLGELKTQNPKIERFIFIYLGGDDLNNDPRCTSVRRVIDFGTLSKTEARQAAPELVDLLERTVKPERRKQKRQDLVDRWWQFAYRKNELYDLISREDRVLAIPQVSPHLNVAVVGNAQVFSSQAIVVGRHATLRFPILQSRIHEVWVRFVASTLEDRLRYTPTDCFETFAFPENFETSPILEAAGQAYHDHRAVLMVARYEGMTKTYNRFHDPDERSEDIVRLRELHAEMDRAVLRAYGWDDLAERAEPIFLDETNEDEHAYQGRLFWPSAFRDEVLARLLALNAERHAEELRLGLAPGMSGKGQDADDDAEDEGEGA
jgi:hypothetical protein